MFNYTYVNNQDKFIETRLIFANKTVCNLAIFDANKDNFREKNYVSDNIPLWILSSSAIVFEVWYFLPKTHFLDDSLLLCCSIVEFN